MLTHHINEPIGIQSDNSSEHSTSSDDSEDRLPDLRLNLHTIIRTLPQGVNCSHCTIMNTSVHCVCCREIGIILAKIDEQVDSSMLCIINSVILNM